jgi:hypothetical protein
MNHRRSVAAALAVAGLLALAACGDPNDAPQGAQPEKAAAQVVHYRPVSPDQIERRAQAEAKRPAPWWSDPARHPANQDPPAQNASLWWAQKR